jgi:hypothetical protein
MKAGALQETVSPILTVWTLLCSKIGFKRSSQAKTTRNPTIRIFPHCQQRHQFCVYSVALQANIAVFKKKRADEKN